eukprot:7217672-Prymnesium_polylepis.2
MYAPWWEFTAVPIFVLHCGIRASGVALQGSRALCALPWTRTPQTRTPRPGTSVVMRILSNPMNGTRRCRRSRWQGLLARRARHLQRAWVMKLPRAVGAQRRARASLRPTFGR